MVLNIVLRLQRVHTLPLLSTVIVWQKWLRLVVAFPPPFEGSITKVNGLCAAALWHNNCLQHKNVESMMTFR